MRVLVTGGAGYIGSVLVPILLDRGFEVRVLDNFSYGNTDSLFGSLHNPRLQVISGDVRNADTLKAAVEGCEYAIPLAALVGAPLCAKDPSMAWEVNTHHVDAVSLHCRTILPTTNSGYGIGGEEECTEESPLNPISEYGKSKVAAEATLLQGKRGVSFRLATVFGSSPRQRLDLLVNDFVVKAKRDRSIVLFEEHFRRNYIHIRDVCSAFLYAIDNYSSMCGQAYNVGLSSANLTKRELAEKIKEHLPETTIISSEIGKDPDKRDYLVSNKKLEALGWMPKYTIDDGIREISAAYDMINGGINLYKNY